VEEEDGGNEGEREDDDDERVAERESGVRKEARPSVKVRAASVGSGQRRWASAQVERTAS
jgi:hypothetical protein